MIVPVDGLPPIRYWGLSARVLLGAVTAGRSCRKRAIQRISDVQHHPLEYTGVSQESIAYVCARKKSRNTPSE